MHTLRMSLIVISWVLLSHHEAIHHHRHRFRRNSCDHVGGPSRNLCCSIRNMTRERDNRDYVATLQKLLIAILLNKETLDSTGHPK